MPSSCLEPYGISSQHFLISTEGVLDQDQSLEYRLIAYTEVLTDTSSNHSLIDSITTGINRGSTIRTKHINIHH
jgi:hypothetical protein